MNFSTVSVKRPVTTLMVVFIVLIFGAVSLSNLSMDMLPNLEMPYAIVYTSYTGAGPEEIENLVTKPLESSVGSVTGLKTLISQSSSGTSIIMMEFVDNTDMDNASLEVRERVDLVKGYLPDGANDPMVMKLNPSMMPVVALTVTSLGDMDLVELKRIVENDFESRLEKIDGVASVSISGGRDTEISIFVMPDKLRGYGISVSAISQLLAAENLNLPVGTIMQGDADLTVKTVGEFESIEDIRNLPLTTATGATVYLRDVASVEETFVDQTSYSFINGHQAVSISIQKQSDANTVDVANRVKKEVASIIEENGNLSATFVVDQSEYIETSVSSVANSAIQGGIFAVIVLFLFLRNVRSTLIVGTAIPVSVIATFVLMYFSGITLNIISLGGLALGVGMLVDNAIVVLENIYRHRELGENRVTASINGAGEIGMAVLASTLTTVAVFLPIIFVEGMVGQIFKELALTVSFSLMASLAVALTWVPMASSKILKITKYDPEKRNFLGKILDAWGVVLDKIDIAYRRLLNWAVHHKKIVCLITAVFFVFTLWRAGSVGMEYFGGGDEGSLSISIGMPKGTQLDETLKTAQAAVSRVENIPELDEIYLTVGSSGGISIMGGGTDSASITLNLVDKEERSRSTDDVVEEVRNLLSDIPGPEISVSSSSSISMGGSDISFEIYGDDLDELERIADEVKEIIEGVEGAREVTTSLSEATPEAVIRINRDKASQYGITASQVAGTLSTAVRGSVATSFKVDGTEIDVRIRQDPENINYITDVGGILIQSPTGAAIPLYELADIYSDDGPITITRTNQRRYVTVTGSIYGRDLNSVNSDIEAALSQYYFPTGYYYEAAGSFSEMLEAFVNLALALMLSIVLVYMVMASQFESLRYPFIILMSIPIALTGGIFGLLIMGMSLSVVGFIGLIMLAGIVVNNGIVLIDYINQLRKEQEMEMMEAIVTAGPTRLRPILMTTMTTVLGLLPMMLASGSGSEMQKPLAVVVVFGLTLSTVVTLVFIPVVYAIMDDLKNILKRYVDIVIHFFNKNHQ